MERLCLGEKNLWKFQRFFFWLFILTAGSVGKQQIDGGNYRKNGRALSTPASREKQVPRCARNDSQKSKCKSKSNSSNNNNNYKQQRQVQMQQQIPPLRCGMTTNKAKAKVSAQRARFCFGMVDLIEVRCVYLCSEL